MEKKNGFQEQLEKHLEETKGRYIDFNLSNNDKKTLLTIARNTLISYLDKREIPEVITDEPALLEPRATFVTLRKKEGNELRGCKGEIFPKKPLVEAIQHTAISTAISDPRFPRVTLEELPYLSIEISILKPLRPINPDDIILGKHGLVISGGDNAGLLLPHVPIICNLDKSTFLKELCNKAGLDDEAWKNKDTCLYAFEAEILEEE